MLTLWPWFCHEMEIMLGGWCVGEGAREERDVGVDALDVGLGFSWLPRCAPRMITCLSLELSKVKRHRLQTSRC